MGLGMGSNNPKRKELFVEGATRIASANVARESLRAEVRSSCAEARREELQRDEDDGAGDGIAGGAIAWR